MESVTYIVDADLIRFAKFAFAMLGIFIIVGITLYGFNLKNMSKELSNAHSSLKEAQAKLEMTKVEMNAGLKELQLSSQRVENLLVETEQLKQKAEDAIQVISQREQRSHEILVAMEADGTPMIKSVTTKEQPPAPAGYGRLWPPGTRLKVAVVDGTDNIRDTIRKATLEWAQHANLTFEFDADLTEADIRISLTPDTSWSYIGMDALMVLPLQPTMNLSSNLSAVEIYRKALYLFGFVIGLQHEHANPNATIPWNEEAVYRDMTGPPSFRNREGIFYNMFRKWDFGSYPFEKPYDPTSIMHWAIKNNWTIDDVSITPSEKLSEGDKQWVAKLYPKSN